MYKLCDFVEQAWKKELFDNGAPILSHMIRALDPFTGEDGDAFCERFRWLRVETPSEFQRIAAQLFAAFAN